MNSYRSNRYKTKRSVGPKIFKTTNNNKITSWEKCIIYFNFSNLKSIKKMLYNFNEFWNKYAIRMKDCKVLLVAIKNLI